jgi:hypothetical protein
MKFGGHIQTIAIGKQEKRKYVYRHRVGVSRYSGSFRSSYPLTFSLKSGAKSLTVKE